MVKIPIKHILTAGILITLFVLIFMLVSVAQFMFVEQAASLSVYPFIYAAVTFAFAYFSSTLLKTKPLSFFILLVIVSFLVNLLVVLWAQTEPVSDFGHLYALANALKNHELETLRNDSYFLSWAYQSFFVIYEAIIISIFPGGITPLLIMNSLFLAGIVGLIYLISREVFQEKAAMFIAILYLFYPAPYFLASVLTNQHISLFFILLGILVFIRKNNAKSGVISGIFFGIGNAFRPDAVIIMASLMVTAVIIRIINWKEKFAEYIIANARFLLSIATNIIVGLLISAVVVLSGVNPNGQTNSDPLWKFVIGLNAETQGGYSDELAHRVFDTQDIDARHELESEIISQHMSIDKRALLSFLADKAADNWKSYEDTAWAFQGQNDRNVPIINKPLGNVLEGLKQAERLYFLLIVSLSAFSLIALLRKKEAHILLVLCGLAIVLFFGIYIFIEVQPRYRYFLVPFIFLLSGTGADWLLNIKKQVFHTSE